MFKIFLGVFFWVGAGVAVLETEDMTTTNSVKVSSAPGISIPPLPNPDELPANGIVLSPETKNKARKAACCACLMCPCICMIGCFNAITSRINRMTCGCFYQTFPCLNFD